MYFIQVDLLNGIDGRRASSHRNLLAELDSVFSDAINHYVNHYEESVRPGLLEGMHYYFTRRQLLRAMFAKLIWDEDGNVSRLENHPASLLFIDQLTSTPGMAFNFDLPDNSYNIIVIKES